MNEMRLNKARLNVVSLNKALINGAVERHGSSAGGGGAPSKYIRFADPAVEAVLMANGVSSDGVGITKEDAAAVKSIKTWFKGNTEITSFNEFKYFTGIYLDSSMHNAFQNCTNLSSVELPILTTSGSANSANGLFYGCTSLIHVTMADGSNYVGYQWFKNCSNLQAFALPKSLTQIGQEAFDNCSSWNGVVDCPNLTQILSMAFRNSGITRVDNLGSVTTTSAQTFSKCPNLESVVLPDTLTDIGYYAFGDCPKLAYVDMPEGVATIGNQAFQNCTSLYFEYLNIPNVTVLNNKAFYGVKIKKMNISGMSALPSAGVNSYHYGDANTLEEIIVNENIPDVPNYSFFSYSKLRSFSAPNVTSIGERSFGGCSSLESVNLGDKFTSIGARAFDACSLLKEIYLPPTLLTIGQQALGNCDLGVLDIPSSVTDISSIAFAGNKNMEYAVCRAITPPTLGASAWNATNDCPIYVPDAALEVYKTATNWSTYAARIHPLSELEGSPYITFEDPAVEAICVENWSSDGIGLTKEDAAAVTDIGDKFKNNTEIVSFDEFRYFTGVTQVGGMLYYDSGFRGCTNLERITLPDSVVDLGYNSFYNTKISTINLDHVVRMHAQVFFNCANLSGDIVAESLTTMIGEFQFYGTSISSFSAPLLAEVGVGAFRKSGIVYANNLGKLKTVEEGGYGMFEQSKVKEVTFPATVETLGAYTCQGANSLQRIRCYAVTPPYLGIKAFEDSGGAYIYVPDASVEAYKTATNWETYAARIYAMKYSEPSDNIAIGSIAIMYSTINQSNAVTANSQFAITDYVPVTGGDKVTWGSAAARAVIVEVDENYAVVDYWSATDASRTITTNAKTKYVRTAFVIPAMVSSFILNETTGEYLFKGKEI